MRQIEWLVAAVTATGAVLLYAMVQIDTIALTIGHKCNNKDTCPAIRPMLICTGIFPCL